MILSLFALSCQSLTSKEEGKVKLITLDPGHFHAALVQKTMYKDVDSVVYVYAPKGQEVEEQLSKVSTYNANPVHPTYWKEEVYLGDDFLQKMLEEKKGNVVILAGNNRQKTEYIKESIEGGFNVLADKPMAIDPAKFKMLENTFKTAEKKKLLLYDIMTERFEITNRLQKEFAAIPELFGTLQKGTPEQPAVEMKSVHYFYKYVSGSILTRPAWFMDVSQQGEAIADVAVHLVDLVQWECFPGQIIDYKNAIKITGAKRWTTDLNLDEFKAITKLSDFPAFLNPHIENGLLKVFSNGEINYQINGVNVKIVALWDYKAKEAGDTHYSKLMGTKANLIIRQGANQGYKPTLYIEPTNLADHGYGEKLNEKMKVITDKFKGVSFKKVTNGWEVIIPEEYKDGHEAHFANVTNQFLGYIKNGNIPKWEIPNILAKYYTTTQALALAKKK
jgi:predicted dehydrogenase